MLAIFELSWAILGSTWLSWGAILVDLKDLPRVLGVPGRFLGDVPRVLAGPVGPGVRQDGRNGILTRLFGAQGVGETDNRTEGRGYVDMLISVQRDILD
jgi:hypothetical protein